MAVLLINGYSTIPSSFGLQGSQSILSHGAIQYSKLLKLHVEETRIVDSLGRQVSLAGFNVHGKWSEWANDAEPWIACDANDLDWMKSKGFNCVRVVMYWEYLEPTQGNYDEARLAELDDFIDLCEVKGVYILLDMHQWGYSTHFPMGEWTGVGIPAWAGPEAYPATVEGRNQFIKDFWANQGNAAATRGYLINFWKFLTNRYKNSNCIFAYDLFNEPWAPWLGEPDGINVVFQYQDFFDKELAPAIRTVDSNTIIAYQNVGIEYEWIDEQLARVKKPTVSNVIWVQNFYGESYESAGNYDSSKKYRNEVVFQKLYNKFHVEFNTPIILTEIGGDMTADNNLLWIDETLDSYYQIFGASWLYWHYGKIGTNPGEGWLPRWNWDEPPQGTDLKDMPVVAILQKYI